MKTIKLMMGIILIAMMTLTFSSCTKNQRARHWGGNETINLPAGEKVVNVTWDGDDHLWILTRERHANERPEPYIMHEKSNWGIIQGTIHINER